MNVLEHDNAKKKNQITMQIIHTIKTDNCTVIHSS